MDLKSILEKHALWLKGIEGGVRADLRKTDLKEANLAGAHLKKANLRKVKCRGNLTETDLEKANLTKADLRGANLKSANLKGANFQGANLSAANLWGANLKEANLAGANLERANLGRANLWQAYLKKAKLNSANLGEADLWGANLTEAELWEAEIGQANFTATNLTYADISWANLSGVNFLRANLSNSNFDNAKFLYASFRDTRVDNASFAKSVFGWTVLGTTDLSKAKNLETTVHWNPSIIGIDCLTASKGNIPVTFLRQCGLSDWEIECSRLYDPALTAGEVSEILSTKLFTSRTDGPIFMGGIFISYSHVDSEFADKLCERLKESGAAVWLDRHDLVAGDVTKQISKSIRINDIVILVLSQNSVNSDFVEGELEHALRKENEENRDALCPVALDGSWAEKTKSDFDLWRKVAKKVVLDFSDWETSGFESAFEKLLKGLKINYPKKS